MAFCLGGNLLSTAEMAFAPTTVAGCSRCLGFIEPGSKFCGNCGAPTRLEFRFDGNSLSAAAAAQAASNAINREAALKLKEKAAPAFVQNKRKTARVPDEIREEMNSIYVSMARERFFLILHYCVFLGTNLIGFFIACKCYFEFIGDDITRLMMATTPLMFINLVALTCLVPIKGTKRELARLKERETYIKLRLEFDSVMEV